MWDRQACGHTVHRAGRCHRCPPSYPPQCPLTHPPLQSIAHHVGVSGSVDQLCRDPKVTKELLAQLTATAKEGKLKVGVVGWGLVNGRMGGRLGGYRAARLPGGMAHLPTL